MCTYCDTEIHLISTESVVIICCLCAIQVESVWHLATEFDVITHYVKKSPSVGWPPFQNPEREAQSKSARATWNTATTFGMLIMSGWGNIMVDRASGGWWLGSSTAFLLVFHRDGWILLFCRSDRSWNVKCTIADRIQILQDQFSRLCSFVNLWEHMIVG